MKCVGGNSAEERAKQTQRIKDMKVYHYSAVHLSMY